MERCDEEHLLHPLKQWDVKGVKKKWNNLKGSAKACVDCSRREARMTGGWLNEAGEVEDEDILVLNSDIEVSTSVTDRVSQMLSSTFTGIRESFDQFKPPTTLAHKQKLLTDVQKEYGLAKEALNYQII